MAPTARPQSPEREQPSNVQYPTLPAMSIVLDEIRRLRAENEQLITENGELNAQAQKDWDTLHPDLETTANVTSQTQDTTLQTLVRALENLRTPSVTHQSSAKALPNLEPLTDGQNPKYESWKIRMRNKIASNNKDYAIKL